VDAPGPLDEKAAIDEPLQVHTVNAEAVELGTTHDPLPTDQFEHALRLGVCGHGCDILSAIVSSDRPLNTPSGNAINRLQGPDLGELMQAHDDRDVFQPSPDELPVIDIHSL
jgi:hypothetical protein